MKSDDQRIADEAVVFAKANRKGIARRLTDPSIFLSEDSPVSVFMAGSPGAGKTEASLEFLSRFGGSVLRIDPDNYRSELPGYTGSNSSLFQRAVSVLVSAVHDEALRLQQSFLLDGTSSNYETVARNIQRSLKRGGLYWSCMSIKTRNAHGSLCRHAKRSRGEIFQWRALCINILPQGKSSTS